MSGFTQHIDSPFPDENILFNSASGLTGQQLQKNQLAIQGQQMDLTAADHEQVGRLAAGLLAEPDLGKRAELYSRGVGMLQAQNLAKYAPPTLPDESTLRSLVSQTIPAQTQAEWLQNLTANKAYTNAGNTASTAAPASTTGAAAPSSVPIPARGTGGPGASASAPPEWLPYYEEASKATGIPVDLLIAQTRQESGFNPNAKGAAGEVGLFQIKPSTAQSPGFGMTGVDPATLTGPDNVRNNIMFGAQYLRARMGGGDPTNPAVQAAGLHAYNGGGDPNYVQNVFRYRPTLAPSDPNAAVTAYTPPTAGATTATAAPTTAQPGQPVPTQVAGPPMVSTAPAAPTAAPGGPTLPPAQTDTTQPPATTAAAPAPTTQPAQPGVRQPPQPPQPPPAGPLPPPPQMPVLNANGLTDIQQRQVNAIAANPQNKQPAVAAAQQAFVNQNIQLRQQAFSDYMQQQQLAVAQGTLSNAQYEARLKAWQAANPVPTSPRPIQGTASWDADAKQWVPATPGQPAVQGVWAYNNQGRGEFQPAAGVPAQGAYENMKTAYSGDVPTIKVISESGRTAQASALQLNELADVIKGVQSGGILPEFRAKVAALMEANGAKPETIQAMTGMSSGSDAQVLQKLAVATIGASAKSDLGSNVGVESLNLYAGANPGLDKLQDANKRVTNMIRVAREQIDSYSLGAQQHFNQNQTSMLHTPQGQVPDYHPLSEYNEKWQAQNNPQIGAAAIGILNGDGFDKWAARAGPEEALNAVRLAARIDPNIQIPVKGGGFKTAQEVLSHGAGQ